MSSKVGRFPRLPMAVPYFSGVILFLTLLNPTWSLISSPLAADHLEVERILGKVLYLPEFPRLSLKTARDLCEAINNTVIPHQHQFLWTPLRNNEDALQGAEESQPLDALKTTPCLTFEWKSCSGVPRYPLTPECGHFQLRHRSEMECLQAGLEGKKEGERGESEKPTTTRTSTPTAFYIDHARAAQLCLTVNRLPSNAQELSSSSSFIKFTPIHVELDPAASKALSRECVLWKFTPCGKFQESDSECGEWESLIRPIEKCEIYREFFAQDLHNATNPRRRWSNNVEEGFDFQEVDTQPPVDNKLDDLESSDVPKGSHSEDVYADQTEASLLTNLIRCHRSGEGKDLETVCSVQPPKPKQSREKRDLESLTLKNRFRRSPRSCCHPYDGCEGCRHSFFPSLSAYRGWGFCNCGDFCVIGACDKRIKKGVCKDYCNP